MMHETKKEFLKSSKLLAFFYLTGVIKLIPFGVTYKKKYRYDYKFRIVHPISWILIIYNILSNGFNKQTFKDIKKDTVIM